DEADWRLGGDAAKARPGFCGFASAAEQIFSSRRGVHDALVLQPPIWAFLEQRQPHRTRSSIFELRCHRDWRKVFLARKSRPSAMDGGSAGGRGRDSDGVVELFAVASYGIPLQVAAVVPISPCGGVVR